MRIAPFDLEQFFARWEFTARYMLGSSDAETLGMHELLDMSDPECRHWWQTLRLGYTEVPGHPLLREAISALYANVRAEQIGVFAGAEEAVFAFMNVVMGRGDHAVVVWPAYQGLYEVARACGADVTHVPIRHEEDWALQIDRLEAAIRPNTRAIAINFPHNPTGAHIDRAALDRIVELARAHDAWLFSDEVYRFAELDDRDRLPAAADVYERGVSLGVMSKAFGLAGLRIGWIASRDARLLASLLSFKHYLTICSSAPAEVLSTIALRARNRILSRNREIATANLRRLDAFFGRWESALEWVRPRAGTTAFPRFRNGVSIDAFAEELAVSTGVLLLPGTVFGHPGNHFRLGFARRDLPVSLALLDSFLLQRVPA